MPWPPQYMLPRYVSSAMRMGGGLRGGYERRSDEAAEGCASGSGSGSTWIVAIVQPTQKVRPRTKARRIPTGIATAHHDFARRPIRKRTPASAEPPQMRRPWVREDSVMRVH